MFIPDVINTLLMGLIFIVILVTVIRPIVLNIVPAFPGDDERDKQAVEAVNQHLLRHFQDAAAARTAEIRYRKMLLQLPPKAKPSEPELPAWALEPDEEPLEASGVLADASPDASVDAVDPSSGVAADASAAGEASAAADGAGAPGEAAQAADGGEGDIEIGEGETLADIKERLKREQEKNKKKPAIPPELLNSANSYEDKVGVVRMVVQADHSRVASLVRSMVKVDGK